MATIKLGPKFFKKERDNSYSDWPTAFWREFDQNSLDAGATKIEHFIKGNEATIIDNGKGMSREVIEDVFFALGETTKNDSNSVGGFGRARILTCFSMVSYTIHTGNILVKGSGAEYEITEIEEYQKGCKFVVVFDDKDENEMLTALRLVLSRSQIDDADVYVNDEKWTNWMFRRKQTRELQCGGVFVNNSKPSNYRIIVRVKGLYMFDLHTMAKPQVIVEVDPARSRSILTSNRDSFHSSYQSNLTQFLAEIAIDKKSALTSRKRITTLVRGNGIIISRSNINTPVRSSFNGRKVAASSYQAPDVAETISVEIGPDDQEPASEGENVSNESQRDQPNASAPVDAVEETVIDGEAFTTDLPSIYLNDETNNPKMRKAMRSFDPRKWVHATKYVRGTAIKYRKGATYLKLLLVWKAAVEEAISVVMQIQKKSQISWLVGWDFSDEAAASIAHNIDGAHAVCLNPLDQKGQMRYKISSRQDLRKLMALAKHEVAHIFKKYHDEDFSSLHTEIDGRYDVSAALRKMREAISSVN